MSAPTVASSLRARYSGEVGRRLGRFALLCALGVLIAFGCWWSRPLDGALTSDFASFIVSGRAAAQGLDPYGLYPALGSPDGTPNLNPPISVPLFEALAGLDPLAVCRVWYLVSVGLYLLAVAFLARAYPAHASPVRIAWLLALMGLWTTLQLGQVYTALVPATVAAWGLLERRRYAAAGLLIGLVGAIKPNLLIWPALLLIAGYPTAAVPAFGTAAVASLLPALGYGPEIYVEWLQASRGYNGGTHLGNASALGTAARLGLPWLGVLVGAGVAGVAATWAWRRRPPPCAVSAVALVAALIASPLTWPGYVLLLLPLLFTWRWTRLHRVVAVLLVTPWPIMQVAMGDDPWRTALVSSSYCSALLAVLVALLREEMSGSTQAPSPSPDQPRGRRARSDPPVSARVGGATGAEG